MDQSSFESWIEFRNFHRRIADSIFKLNKDQCFSISSIRSKLCFADQVVFDNCFLFFLFFLSSEKDCKLLRQALPDFRSECYRPNLKIIFCFLISLSVFIRFHKFTEFFKCFLFLLRYRGLSNTGFHVLQQLGMSPCVRLIPKVISSVRSIWTPQRPTHYVLWGDNLRRELKGRLPSLNREDHTVTGYVSLVNPLPFINDRYSGSANIVDGKYLDQICLHLETTDFLKGPLSICVELLDRTRLSNPIRVPGTPKFKFVGEHVFPFAIGTVYGTCKFLQMVHSRMEKAHYTLIVVDYDIMWRIWRAFHSKDLIGPFDSLQSSCIFFQAPWHIYKRIAELVWKTFAPLVFADLWLIAYDKPCPAKPALRDMLPFFIVIRFLATSVDQSHKGPIFDAIFILCNTFIPLVRSKPLFFFLLLTKIYFRYWNWVFLFRPVMLMCFSNWFSMLFHGLKHLEQAIISTHALSAVRCGLR